MAIMSIGRCRSVEAVRAAPVSLRPCRFERTLIRGGLAEGGILTCFDSAGHERSLHVSMTWDVLAELRATLARRGFSVSDDEIVRCVLRQWGIEEFSRRLNDGTCLPEERLVLDCVGGPCNTRPRRLLQACGLLPPAAA